MAFNVLGTALVPCSYDPLTGYYRDGCCNTAEDDTGSHVVCVKVTAEFLAYSASRGNGMPPTTMQSSTTAQSRLVGCTGNGVGSSELIAVVRRTGGGSPLEDEGGVKM